MLSTAEILRELERYNFSYITPDNNLFDVVNTKYFQQYRKRGIARNDSDSTDDEEALSPFEYFCHIPGCLLPFDNTLKYREHHETAHRFKCSTCYRFLPTPYLLSLHVSEQHDEYLSSLAEDGVPIYACFLEECEEKMLTPEQRKNHCLTVHDFAPSFRFDHLCGTKSKPIKSTSTKNQTSETVTTKRKLGRPKKKTDDDTISKEIDPTGKASVPMENPGTSLKSAGLKTMPAACSKVTTMTSEYYQLSSGTDDVSVSTDNTPGTSSNPFGFGNLFFGRSWQKTLDVKKQSKESNPPVETTEASVASNTRNTSSSTFGIRNSFRKLRQKAFDFKKQSKGSTVETSTPMDPPSTSSAVLEVKEKKLDFTTETIDSESTDETLETVVPMNTASTRSGAFSKFSLLRSKGKSHDEKKTS